MSTILSIIILLAFIIYTLRFDICSYISVPKKPSVNYKEPDMDKAAIKQAAIDLKNALQAWCDREEIKKIFNDTRNHWTQEELDKAVVSATRMIDGILEPYEPIFRLAIQEEIHHPFAFSLYMGSFVGRTFTDELSWPQISKPYFNLCDVLRGGLSLEEAYLNHYYANRILPEKYHQIVAEIAQEKSLHRSS